MRKILIATILLGSSILFCQSIPKIVDLKGMEDANSKTYLFYRVGNSYNHSSYSIVHTDIFVMSENNDIDSMFLPHTLFDLFGGYEIWYEDFTFWNHTLQRYIACGTKVETDAGAVIKRFNGLSTSVPYFYDCSKILISPNNSRKVFVSNNHNYTISSNDSGKTWQYAPDELYRRGIIAINKYDARKFYATDQQGLLNISSDTGKSFSSAGSGDWSIYSRLFFDKDKDHIYGVSYSYGNTYSLYAGIHEDFYQKKIISSNKKISVAMDDSISGEVYYALGYNIFKSTNHGQSFTLLKTLDQTITGLYKKPNSNILFVSTTNKIIKISPDSSIVLKSTRLQNITAIYPLQKGNTWKYSGISGSNLPPYETSSVSITRTVMGDTVMPNKMMYKVLSKQGSSESYEYIRLDALNGYLYKYDPHRAAPNNEIVIAFFYGTTGDTLYTDSNNKTICDNINSKQFGESTFTKLDFSSLYKNFWGAKYGFLLGIGEYEYSAIADWSYYHYSLTEAVINGKAYIFTSVNDQENKNLLPDDFNLFQNYPNPFNPVTTIRYRLPVASFVTLKVYNVLGNEVATLVNEYQQAGNYNSNFSISNYQLSSGVYFYRLTVGDFFDTKKMILLK